MKDLIEEVVFEPYPENEVEFQKETIQELRSKGIEKNAQGKRIGPVCPGLENTEGGS